MYTDNFEEEILFIPARKDGEACNHLKIVTAFTDVERISSHLIKLFDGRNKEYVSGIKVDIILGMTKGTGLTQKKHDKICSLIKRLNSVSGMPQISCNYIVEGKQVHSKVYVWCRGRKAIEAFNGSANYTMNAFFVRRECMDACNPKEANHYFNSLLPDTINCFDGQIKDKVSFSSKKNVEDDVADTNLENLSWENYRTIEPVDTLEVSLLKADGSDTGYGSGVNWGIRKNGYKRNRNQAYIPYNVADHKDGFFPDINADGTYPVFKVVTKECITYTNRAAEELGKDVDSNRVYFGTIHSFINDFIGSFFSHESILELYWEVYKNQIVERIENVSQNGNWAESNMRYIEKYGGLTPEIVRSNITMISYNQAPFNSLYRGALGHDDLISFTRLAVERFPVIKKKISDKYQVVFIDEYQDTATDVLQIFYSSMIGKKSKLYLLGDKMQQIYRNYNGEFETYFNIFNKSINLSVNYRTTPKIVSILNKIYNDECYKQTAYEKNKDENMDFLPEVRIVTDIEKNVSELMEQYKDSLILYLSNKSRFYNIGVGELYDAYSGMEKYSFGKKYNAVDVLTKEEIRENDALLSFLFTVNIIVDYFTKEFYGEVFRIIRKAGTYFNCEKFIIRKHIDKHLVKDKLDDIVALYNELSTTVDDFLSLCVEKKYIREEFYSAVVEENDYQLVKNVKVQEVKVLADYMSDPKISTQHGVKGESHDTVVFVADNSRSNPVVHMSKFFEMWSNIDITLSEFDAFYYIYSQMLNQIENKIGMKCSQLKADTYISVASIIDEELQAFTKKNETNPYYVQLLKVKMDKYFGKKNVTNVKECLKEGTVYGPLCAYRLFYVGCSRAKRNLVIMINKKDIEGFEDKLRNKLMITGFNVL